MGVVNVTPDSFSDGGKFFDTKTAQHQILELIRQGANIIDIGGESTGPESPAVSLEEEVKRVKPIIDFVDAQSLTKKTSCL